MTTEWVRVADSTEVKTVAMRVVNGEPVALFRIDGGLYALSDSCTHEKAPLSEGEIVEGAVLCPRHGSGFDIRTGHVRSLPAMKPVRTWEVREEHGGVFLKTSGPQDVS